MTTDGTSQAPILRLHHGDQLKVNVHNDLPPANDAPLPGPGVCGASAPTPTSTNLHMHGALVPPVCHEDDIINTIVNSGETFAYDITIPSQQPPGLYWYHPLVYTTAKAQLDGGATGAYVVEGIENVQPLVGGLPEQIFVFRHEELLFEDFTSAMPDEDLSINHIPIPYPDYPTPTYRMKPGEMQFWRVANTMASTTLDIQLLYGTVPQNMIGIARDGQVFGSHQNATVVNSTHWRVPVGGRIEFIVEGPSQGVPAQLLTLSTTDPGQFGSPGRPLLTIVADVNAATPSVIIPMPSSSTPLPRLPQDVLLLTPVATRNLDFVIQDTGLYLTVRGQPNIPYLNQSWPMVNATQGTVEDWIITNPTNVSRPFHINQLHFLLLEKDGVAVSSDDEQYMDVILVETNSSVKIRLDFTGNFMYEYSSK